jgi:methylenetetrahydrofolate reductase (NADPH)
VYQKGYVEFFCSPDALPGVTSNLQACKSLSFMTASAAGKVEGSSATTGVAWGSFPDSEVKQALVTCADGFAAWSKEAFDLWDMWADELEAGSPGKTVIDNIKNSWYLVSVVENNYVSGDVFSFL